MKSDERKLVIRILDNIMIDQFMFIGIQLNNLPIYELQILMKAFGANIGNIQQKVYDYKKTGRRNL